MIPHICAFTVEPRKAKGEESMNKLLPVLAALLLAPAATPTYAQVAQQAQPAITGQGKVNKADAAGNTLNLTHGPIEALKWPAMTMDFVVLPGTDLSQIKPGDNVTFTLGRAPDGMYAINGIKKN